MLHMWVEVDRHLVMVVTGWPGLFEVLVVLDENEVDTHFVSVGMGKTLHLSKLD